MTLALLYPVTVCRSDGVLEFTRADGTKDPNTPAENKIGKITTPDANGKIEYFLELDENHPKAIDWRSKLGVLLMSVLGGSTYRDRQYILKEFPKGYRLFEHITIEQDENGNPSHKKNHAAGTFSRYDVFLYGYPDRKKKKFRSPADFFLHLLWLASDSAGDHDNCTCLHCSPKGEDRKSQEPTKAPPQEKEEETENKKPVKPPPSIAKPSSGPAPNPALTQRPINTLPASTQYSVKSREQEFDYNPDGPYIYRPGELIWFNNGANWRLGLIEKRGLYGLQKLPRYLIQPLSNPLQHQPSQTKDQMDMRPWLAWSVPNTTVAPIQNLTFDQVPWDQVLRGELDVGLQTDYVVDGSILAAKTIDASYSLFDRDESAIVQPDSMAYKGMFLGAEKIWVGEPVRLKLPGVDVAVYIISTMVENQATNSVTFKGDIYKLARTTSNYTHKSQWPAPSKELPTRMVVDLNYRNEIAARKNEFYDWKLIDTGAYKQIDDIKGRWYEMKTLLPTLKGEPKYFEDIDQGITGDSGQWMNSRRDNNTIPNQRKKNRKDALGKSVPESFKPSRGLDGLETDDLFPDQLAPATRNSAQAGTEDISRFMNLDGGGYYI